MAAVGQRFRILCVDDDDDLTRIIKARLLRFRVEVSRAANGKDGLKLAHSHRPDAIITDLGMSNGDGEYLLGRLKKRPSTASIPVIVISGVDDPERKSSVYKLGASAILHKPLDFETLFSELAVHLNCSDTLEKKASSDAASTSILNGRNLRMDAEQPEVRPPTYECH